MPASVRDRMPLRGGPDALYIGVASVPIGGALDWYKFYVGDYARDTSHLTPLEHGVYLLLINRYYSAESPLRDDFAFLCRVAQCRSRHEKNALRSIRDQFFDSINGELKHRRIDEEILKYQQMSHANRNAAAMRWQCKNDAIPDTRNQIPEQRPKTLAQDKPARASTQKVNGAEFDAFWNAYPKKRNKADAHKAWAKLKPDAELYRRIMASLDAHKRAPDWSKDGGQFVPYPASWLRAGGFDDVIEIQSFQLAAAHGRQESQDDDPRDNSAPARVRRAQRLREERERAAAFAEGRTIDAEP